MFGWNEKNPFYPAESKFSVKIMLLKNWEIPIEIIGKFSQYFSKSCVFIARNATQTQPNSASCQAEKFLILLDGIK